MPKLFNISEAASIAIHSLGIIANSKELVNTKRIAEMTGFSKNHIATVLQILARSNYVESVRGPKGGFILKKSADEITLLHIYELIEGELETEHCRKDHERCPFEDCVYGNVRERLSEEFKEFFKNRKLSDLKTI